MVFLSVCVVWVGVILWPVLALGEDIYVAVASNFKHSFQVLAKQFEQKTDHRLIISSGSSGKLFAQIKQGAPFHLFLSADLARPQQLEKEGFTVPGSLFTYAKGRLVVWSLDPNNVAKGADSLIHGSLPRLAMANPTSAPYGLAAKETLMALNLWKTHKEKPGSMVFGESVGQTLAFVLSGNADVGFVSLAQIQHKKETLKGGYWMVPDRYYQPLEQGAVRLKQSSALKATQDLTDFLQADTTLQVIQRLGYVLP